MLGLPIRLPFFIKKKTLCDIEIIRKFCRREWNFDLLSPDSWQIRHLQISMDTVHWTWWIVSTGYCVEIVDCSEVENGSGWYEPSHNKFGQSIWRFLRPPDSCYLRRILNLNGNLCECCGRARRLRSWNSATVRHSKTEQPASESERQRIRNALPGRIFPFSWKS